MAHKRTRNELSLAKIIVGICITAAAAYAVYRATQWVSDQFVGGPATAQAPVSLVQAQALLEEGKAEEARALLLPIANRVRNSAVTPQALLMLADIEIEANNADIAMEYLRRAANEFPDSPDQPRAAVRYAQLLERSGGLQEALAIYDNVNETAVPELRAPALSGLARQAESQGRLIEARDLFRQAVKAAKWGSTDWDEAADGLGRMNVALIFSPEETPESQAYVIEPGDNLTNIGMKLNTTQGLLNRANNIVDETRLRVGQRLKYTPKDFRIVIERSTCRIFLLDGDGLFKYYRTGLGKPGHETTLGSYRIGNKQVDPTWFKPNHGPIPPGHPENELGTRWMPLVPEREDLPTDLGIHGTIAPETIGSYSSHGCARLTKEDVEELYDLVVRSTPVDIVETVDPALVVGR